MNLIAVIIAYRPKSSGSTVDQVGKIKALTIGADDCIDHPLTRTDGPC